MKKFFIFNGKRYRCVRCDSLVSRINVSQGYFAYCPTHDEDLYRVEVYQD